MATQVLEAHIKRTRVKFASSHKASPPPQHMSNDRSASPTLTNNNDEEVEKSPPQADSHDGLLGIILDLYKLHALDVLQAGRPEEPLDEQGTPGYDCRHIGLDDFASSSTLNSSGSKGNSATTSFISTSSATAEKTCRRAWRRWRRASLKGRPFWPDDEQTVTHVTEAIRSHITRQLYLIRLCRALMTFGAPIHHLEA